MAERGTASACMYVIAHPCPRFAATLRRLGTEQRACVRSLRMPRHLIIDTISDGSNTYYEFDGKQPQYEVDPQNAVLTVTDPDGSITHYSPAGWKSVKEWVSDT